MSLYPMLKSLASVLVISAMILDRIGWTMANQVANTTTTVDSSTTTIKATTIGTNGDDPSSSSTSPSSSSTTTTTTLMSVQSTTNATIATLELDNATIYNNVSIASVSPSPSPSRTIWWVLFLVLWATNFLIVAFPVVFVEQCRNKKKELDRDVRKRRRVLNRKKVTLRPQNPDAGKTTKKGMKAKKNSTTTKAMKTANGVSGGKGDDSKQKMKMVKIVRDPIDTSQQVSASQKSSGGSTDSKSGDAKKKMKAGKVAKVAVAIPMKK